MSWPPASQNPRPDVRYRDHDAFLDEIKAISEDGRILEIPQHPRWPELDDARRKSRRRIADDLAKKNKRLAAAKDTTQTNPLAIPPERVIVTCKKALGWLSKEYLLPIWAERDELLGVGYQAVYSKHVSEISHVFTVAHSAMVDWLRYQGKRRLNCVELVVRDNDNDTYVDERGFLEPQENTPGVIGRDAQVAEAMKALPPRQYRAVHLFFWGGYPQAEIAECMGTTTDAVQKLIARAQANMRLFL